MEWFDKILCSTASAAVYRDPDDWPRDGGSGGFNFGIDDVACIIFFVMSIKILYFIFTHPMQKDEETSAILSVVLTIALVVILPHEVLVTAGWIELLLVETCKDPKGMTGIAKFALGAGAAISALTLYCGTFNTFSRTFEIIVIASVCVMILAKFVQGIMDSLEEQGKEEFEKAPLFTYSDGLRYYKGEPNYLVWDGGNHVFAIASLSSARIVGHDNGHAVVSFSSYMIQAEKPERVLKNCEHRFVEFTYCGNGVIYVHKPRYYEVHSSYAIEALKKIYIEARKNPR
ncbi:MAG: hypothetical protein PUE51_06380 [Veillonellaceae bacterium]|nr:hypothetical protein [Veillonellaceae bacterium]